MSLCPWVVQNKAKKNTLFGFGFNPPSPHLFWKMFRITVAFLADPGKAMSSTNYKQTDPFPPTALRRRHGQTVRYRSFSYSD